MVEMPTDRSIYTQIVHEGYKYYQSFRYSIEGMGD